MRIIGIVGPMGSGKTTLAEQLVKFYDFERTRFASPLKLMIETLLTSQGCSRDKARRMLDGELKEVPSDYLGGKTPRWAMQSLGTEWGRRLIANGLWVEAWENWVKTRGRSVVVDDCRFVNEANKIRELGGKIVRVDREGCAPGQHASEIEYLQIKPDVVFKNPVPVGTQPQSQKACMDEMIAVFSFSYFSQLGVPL